MTSNQIFFIVPLVLAFLQVVVSFPAANQWENFCKRPKPWSIETIRPEFHVFTKTNNTKFFIRNETDIPNFIDHLEKEQFLQKDRSVIFLVHGYMRTPNTLWMHHAKDAILNIKNEDSAIIIVNWPIGADDALDYEVSASNTQTVAHAIATFALAILNSNTFKGDRNLLYLHCIGHSLGAHVCGQAGRRARIFDRASGLDPAGPGFEQCPEDDLHIAKDSADCVDNIHTDGISQDHWWNSVIPHFGTLKEWGHVDFYPNGGGNQPGCGDQWTSIGCSHGMVTDYYVYTIQNGPDVCRTTSCFDPKSIDCIDKSKQPMGYYSSCHGGKNKLNPGMFSLVTKKAQPYC